jgi:hypothetical protein
MHFVYTFHVTSSPCPLRSPVDDSALPVNLALWLALM